MEHARYGDTPGTDRLDGHSTAGRGSTAGDAEKAERQKAAQFKEGNKGGPGGDRKSEKAKSTVSQVSGSPLIRGPISKILGQIDECPDCHQRYEPQAGHICSRRRDHKAKHANSTVGAVAEAAGVSPGRASTRRATLSHPIGNGHVGR